MGWTKKQLLEASFDEIGLASYVFDNSPDQLTIALWKMDAMVANWTTEGIYLSYPTYSNPQNSRIDEDSNVPEYAVAAIYLKFACQLGNPYGKEIPASLEKEADKAYGNMLNQIGKYYLPMRFPETLPRGQGTKPWRNFNNPFITPMPTPLDTGVGTNSNIPAYQCNMSIPPTP